MDKSKEIEKVKVVGVLNKGTNIFLRNKILDVSFPFSFISEIYSQLEYLLILTCYGGKNMLLY